MLIKHEFDAEKHLYTVPGQFVLATGDVISLNGLSDVSGVPPKALEYAGHRGRAVHEAILAYETDCDVEDVLRGYEVQNKVNLMDDCMERMGAYMRFRDCHEVSLAGKMEVTRVYQHIGTEYLIGATPDLPCFIDGELSILDAKTCFKQYGQMAKQLHLKWRLQLQSYVEAVEADEDFWNPLQAKETPKKRVLHLHPKCGAMRGQEPTGFELHKFDIDDSFLWDGAIRMAFAKISMGYKLEKN